LLPDGSFGPKADLGSFAPEAVVASIQPLWFHGWSDTKVDNEAASLRRTSMRFSEETLWDHINDGWSRMSFKQRNLWDAIKRSPEEWDLKGYGPFWVVAIIGETVIYYNHFEYGFNRSSWTAFGFIDQFQSLQFELEQAAQVQLDIINSGYDVGPRSSGPIAGEYPGKQSGR
jgi:hypothetical protein